MASGPCLAQNPSNEKFPTEQQTLPIPSRTHRKEGKNFLGTDRNERFTTELKNPIVWTLGMDTEDEHSLATDDDAKIEHKEYQSIACGHDLIKWLKKHGKSEATIRCIENHGMSIVDHTFEKGHIELISEVLSRCSKKHISKLEIVCCGPLESIRKLLQSIRKGRCKIIKLSIEESENLGKLSKDICDLVKSCSPKHLCFRANNLTPKDMEKLKVLLDPEVKKLDEFEVSRNKTLKKAGFKTLGELLRKENGFCRKLTISDCEIEDDQLASLQGSMTDARFNELNINCNSDLTIEGFKTLGAIITSSGVTSVKMSNCEITAEKLSSLKNTTCLAKVKHLDLSYNTSLNEKGIEELARILENYEHCLSLAGCDLNENKLRILRGVNSKLQHLDVSANCHIGEGLNEVVKFTGLSSLNLRDCMLTTTHLKKLQTVQRDFQWGRKRYVESEKGAMDQKTAGLTLNLRMQLKHLDLSDRHRCADAKYVKAVMDLLPHVTKTLTLQFKQIDEIHKESLRKKGIKTGLRIVCSSQENE